MAGYTKLFASILDSTIWQEEPEVKIVWVTMLAMCDKHGEVSASIPGLASRAGVTVEQVESALEKFQSPDRYSRTKDHEGRRIEEIDGGWQLLNHAKYRKLLSAEERREYNARKQREYRAKKRGDMSMTVNDSEQNPHIAEADTDTDTKADAKAEREAPAREIPSADQAERWAREDLPAKRILTKSDETELIPELVGAYFDKRAANDWHNSKGPVGDYRADLSSFARSWLGIHRKGGNGKERQGNGIKAPPEKAAQYAAAIARSRERLTAAPGEWEENAEDLRSAERQTPTD